MHLSPCRNTISTGIYTACFFRERLIRRQWEERVVVICLGRRQCCCCALEVRAVTLCRRAEGCAAFIVRFVGHAEHHPPVLARHKLRLDLRRRDGLRAMRALDRTARHRAFIWLVLLRGLAVQDFYPDRPIRLGQQAVGHRFLTLALAQPAVGHQGNLAAARRVGAADRLGPEVGNDGLARRARVVFGQLFFRALAHPLAPGGHGLHQIARARAGVGLKPFVGLRQRELRRGKTHRIVHRAQERQHRVGVKVVRVGFAAQARRFQGQGAASGEGVQHLGRAAFEGLPDARAHLFENLGIVPRRLVRQAVDD